MFLRLAIAASVLALPSTAQLIVSLSPKTNAEYAAYVRKVEPGIALSARETRPAPWLANYGGTLEQLKKGEIPVHAFTGENGLDISGGIVHDWVGGFLLPGATIDNVLRVLQDFDHHKDWYPEILDSKLLSKSGNDSRGRWTLMKKKVFTVVLNTELQSHYAEVSPEQWYVRSATVSLREIDNYGKPGATEYPQGKGHGFLWRFDSFWTLQQRPEGVYTTLRVVSLSRDIPVGLGRLISPFIRSVPVESLQSTLVHTREAAKRL